MVSDAAVETRDDDQEGPPLKRQRQTKKKTSRKKCVTYSVKSDCMVMSEVVGDEGILNLLIYSKDQAVGRDPTATCGVFGQGPNRRRSPQACR